MLLLKTLKTEKEPLKSNSLKEVRTKVSEPCPIRLFRHLF